MKYELITETPLGGMKETSYVLRTDSDGQVFVIPVDPGNRDYRNYLESLEETE